VQLPSSHSTPALAAVLNKVKQLSELLLDVGTVLARQSHIDDDSENTEGAHPF